MISITSIIVTLLPNLARIHLLLVVLLLLVGLLRLIIYELDIHRHSVDQRTYIR
jgi:hypothetical protein